MALDLYAELRKILAVLNKAHAPYAVVEGIAVSLYAQPRATQGIDPLILESSWNETRLLMLHLGYPSSLFRCPWGEVSFEFIG